MRQKLLSLKNHWCGKLLKTEITFLWRGLKSKRGHALFQPTNAVRAQNGHSQNNQVSRL